MTNRTKKLIVGAGIVLTLAILAGLLYSLAAQTTQTVDIWERNFSKITVVRDSDQVKIQIIEKDPNDATKSIERCGQKLTANQADNLSADLHEASLSADPAR